MVPLVVTACATVRPPVTGKTNAEAAPSSTADDTPTKKQADLSIIKKPVFLTFTAGLGIYYLGMFSPFFFVTSYAISIDLSTSFAFYLVSIINAASLVGRVSAGWVADKYGHFNLCCLGAMSSALVAFCWTAATTSAGLLVWCLAYGYCSGVSLLCLVDLPRLTSPFLSQL